MAPNHQPELDEWLEHKVSSWVETYKKAMLTPTVLAIVEAHETLTVQELNSRIEADMGWQLTERGLYRTIKRLEDSEFLSVTSEEAPRTGAKRKVISLSALGSRMLAGVRQNLVQLPS